MEQEIIMLNKINHTKKDKYHVFSRTWNLNLKNKPRKEGHKFEMDLWEVGNNRRGIGERRG
jgi:hypothetical protein